MTNISNIDTAKIVQITQDMVSLADEIDEFRRENVRNLSISQMTQMTNDSATIRSLSTALIAQTSRIILAGVSKKLDMLSDAIEEADKFLDSITRLGEALKAIASVIGIASSILTLITPVS